MSSVLINKESLATLSEQEFKSRFPGIYPYPLNQESIPDEASGWLVLIEDPVPEISGLEVIEPGEVRFEGGLAFRGWAVTTPAPDWPAIIEARRYEAEVAGVEVDGMGIETTDRSKTLIGFKAVDAMRNPDTEFNFKTTTGFVTLTAAKVLEIFDVVNARVQACFDREEVLLGAVADGTITPEMIEEGWPA